jgi:hypothetical protein
VLWILPASLQFSFSISQWFWFYKSFRCHFNKIFVYVSKRRLRCTAWHQNSRQHQRQSRRIRYPVCQQDIRILASEFFRLRRECLLSNHLAYEGDRRMLYHKWNKELKKAVEIVCESTQIQHHQKLAKYTPLRSKP